MDLSSASENLEMYNFVGYMLCNSLRCLILLDNKNLWGQAMLYANLCLYIENSNKPFHAVLSSFVIKAFPHMFIGTFLTHKLHCIMYIECLCHNFISSFKLLGNELTTDLYSLGFTGNAS